MKKKAQGISINTIIIAAIALIVLVIIVAIFTGRLGEFSFGVANCEDKGGTCTSYNPNQETAASVCEGMNAAPLRGTNCGREDQYNTEGREGICCIPITEE